MQQDLFEGGPLFSVASRPINVASVPQRSPFRYPGGKTWLIPKIRDWMTSFDKKPSTFVEPFAGGAIVSLTVAAENLAEKVVMVELDEQVASVWNTIIGSNSGKWLANRILNFDLASFDSEKLRRFVETKSKSVRERAFKTILKNRTYHGGILAHGSSPIRSGENGKGLLSRWYPQTLSKRINAIIHFKDSIRFIEGDGLEVMQSLANDKNAVFFIDPPYTASGKQAGRRLYSKFLLDHERLFEIAASLKGDFLMTYDDSEGIRTLAERFGFDIELVPMKNTHHAEMTELLIGRELSWVSKNRFHRIFPIQSPE